MIEPQRLCLAEVAQDNNQSLEPNQSVAARSILDSNTEVAARSILDWHTGVAARSILDSHTGVAAIHLDGHTAD